jgi:hypothetical protein
MNVTVDIPFAQVREGYDIELGVVITLEVFGFCVLVKSTDGMDHGQVQEAVKHQEQVLPELVAGLLGEMMLDRYALRESGWRRKNEP